MNTIKRDTPLNPNHDTAGLSTKLAYGFGALANGATSNGFNYLLLFFYSQVIGLPALSANQSVVWGVILGVPAAWASGKWARYLMDKADS